MSENHLDLVEKNCHPKMQIFQKCLVMAKISTEKAVKVKMCCLCWEEPFTNNKYRNNSCGTVTMAGTGLSEWPKVFRILYVYMFDINVWHRFSLLRAFCSSAGFVFLLALAVSAREISITFIVHQVEKHVTAETNLSTSGRPTSLIGKWRFQRHFRFTSCKMR